MQIQVDLLPGSVNADVVIVIDALVSCTVAALLFDRGLETLYLTDSVGAARRQAETAGALLLGERNGVPPEGFNHGSSPAQLARLDAAGRSAVLVSDNAPAALTHFAAAPNVLLGSLYNAAAVAAAAAEFAGGRVLLACCGFRGQEDLDDAVAAGYIAAELGRLLPEATLAGAGPFTRGLLRAFPAPVDAFWHSTAGRYLRRLERTDDLGVAASVSASRSVPVLRAPATGQEPRIHRLTSARTEP